MHKYCRTVGNHLWLTFATLSNIIASVRHVLISLFFPVNYHQTINVKNKLAIIFNSLYTVQNHQTFCFQFLVLYYTLLILIKLAFFFFDSVICARFDSLFENSIHNWGIFFTQFQLNDCTSGPRIVT